jgi:hypothetical protein
MYCMQPCSPARASLAAAKIYLLLWCCVGLETRELSLSLARAFAVLFLKKYQESGTISAT